MINRLIVLFYKNIIYIEATTPNISPTTITPSTVPHYWSSNEVIPISGKSSMVSMEPPRKRRLSNPCTCRTSEYLANPSMFNQASISQVGVLLVRSGEKGRLLKEPLTFFNSESIYGQYKANRSTSTSCSIPIHHS